jgi:EAL domain-containing protein (putative c-di-GMP-specific phosphodiesterase class I)
MLNTGAASTRSHSSLHVLIVEDHPFQRAGIALLLRRMGVQDIREAANGREALAQLQRPALPPADIVLCDLDMPEMDGVQFLRAVAERNLARGVVIISGHDDEILAGAEAMARAQGLMVLGRVKKPVTLEGLRGLLRAPTQPLSSPPDPTLPLLDVALLRRAFERDEFYVEFQPKVSLASGALTGVEALARLQLPGNKPVGPGLFVPVLVRAGLISLLTERVLAASCRALFDWQLRGLALDVAVNVSVVTLADLASADRLATLVRSHGIVPQSITFEVTETELMADPAAVLNVLTRLRLKGFRVAIDDFGTGYSSLAQLNTIPVSELKIDRSFVQGCEGSPRLREIVQSSIELARRLRIRTVAEGVESAAAWEFLRSAGCDEAQGYYISRSMAATDLVVWAAQRRGQARA